MTDIKVRWAGGVAPPTMEQTEVSTIDYTEGSWLELTGKSWMHSIGNPACIQYGMRSGFAGLPIDDKVHYVHIRGLGYLVHESELFEEEAT